MESKLKRHFVVLLVITGILIGASLGSAIAIIIHQLNPEYISLYQNSYAESNFRIDCFTTNVITPNKVVVAIKLTNTDSATHSTNVTVSLMTSSGSILDSAWKLTGDVDGGDSIVLVYVFSVDVTQYDHAFIQIHDLS